MKKSAALLLTILLLTACAKTSGITETETADTTETIKITETTESEATESETAESVTTAEYVIVDKTEYPTDITELDLMGYWEYTDYFAGYGDYSNADFGRFTNLTKLNVYAHNAYGEYCMPKKEDLEKLGGVTELKVFGEFLGDINEITALTNVYDLGIFANTIESIGAAAELPNLKRLTVIARHGVDLSALSEFTGLEYLNLRLGYATVDLEMIKGNVSLTDLYVEVNNGEIINADALSGLTDLKSITLIVDGVEYYA